MKLLCWLHRIARQQGRPAATSTPSKHSMFAFRVSSSGIALCFANEYSDEVWVLLGTLLLNLISLLTLVLWIVLMLKAFQGVRFKVPLAGHIAESLVGRAR